MKPHLSRATQPLAILPQPAALSLADAAPPATCNLQPATRNLQPPVVRRSLAFTLLELLTVIAIIGILAALAAPVLKNFQPNYRATATRQLLDDIARARQLAISQRTTVLMVFLPTNFWTDVAATTSWRPIDWQKATNLLDKQLVGYNFVSLKSLGDQPGVHYPEYLGPWRALPEGAFIALEKFNLGNLPNSTPFLIYTNTANGPVPGFNLYGFDWTYNVPFPALDTPVYNALRHPYVPLPYIAFNYLGQRCDESGNVVFQTQRPAVFPLAKGVVGIARDHITKAPVRVPATASENPPGNATNSLSYNVVVVDWLTGRGRAYQQEIK